MNKFVLILPYFGKFPSYFSFFLNSIENNKEIDLLLITDNEISNLPKNVIKVNTTLKDLNLLIKQKIGNYKVKSAYKLCDYKPLYGLLFEDYLKKYEWWGWVDCDLILGNIMRFIGQIDLTKYDRLFIHGHLALIRNIPKMNKMAFNTVDNCNLSNFVLKNSCIFQFDERFPDDSKYAFPLICEMNNCKTYYKRVFADVSTEDFNFRYKSYDKDNKLIIKEANKFIYDRGGLFTEEKEELLYVHFQKRDMNTLIDPKYIPQIYIIIPNYFCLNEKDISQNELDECRQLFDRKKQKRHLSAKLKTFKKLFILLINFKLNKHWI